MTPSTPPSAPDLPGGVSGRAPGGVTILAVWEVSPEELSEVLRVLPPLRATSLAEPGCRSYEVYRSLERPNRIVLWEVYDDDAAVAAHVASEHYRRFVVEVVRPRLADRRVEKLRPIDAPSPDQSWNMDPSMPPNATRSLENVPSSTGCSSKRVT